MVPNVCICDAVSQLDTRTRVALIMHRREFKKVTNTGRLAVAGLSNSTMLTWGDHEAPFDGAPLRDETRLNLVLTPAEGCVELDVAQVQADGRPVTLIVPDGTWRQATKMPRRIPELAAATWVKLPPGPRTRYRLRDETHEGGLATVEAIARTLGLLGEAEAEAHLTRIFDRMVEATLISRGQQDRL